MILQVPVAISLAIDTELHVVTCDGFPNLSSDSDVDPVCATWNEIQVIKSLINFRMRFVALEMFPVARHGFGKKKIKDMTNFLLKAQPMLRYEMVVSIIRRSTQ